VLELFLKMQAAREKRKTSTTEGTEGRERQDPGCANEADSGSRTGSGEEGQGTMEEDLRLTTEGTENTEGKVGGGPREEVESVSGEGRIAGRAGAGRTIPGRKRIPARGAAGGSEKGRNGEKKGASEANLEMIKQVMAQRFSDMPAARGPRERSHL
jgi:hypothetical protein